jgi:hypothetical protein
MYVRAVPTRLYLQAMQMHRGGRKNEQPVRTMKMRKGGNEKKMKHCIIRQEPSHKDFSLSAEAFAQNHMPMSIVVDAERNHPTHLIKEGIKNQPDSQSTTV